MSSIEPTPLRPSGRRHLTPFLVVAMAAFVALAVLKPWAAGRPDATPPLPAVLPTAPGATEAPAPTGPVPPPLTESEAIASSLPAHDAWGLRVVERRPVDEPPSLDPARDQWFRERWTAAVPPTIDGWGAPVQPEPLDADVAPPHVSLADSGWPIAAIGVTAPRGETPLDVRIWREGPSGPRRLLQTIDVPGQQLRLDRLIAAPPGAAAGDSWAGGRYMVDVLEAGGIRRFDLDLPGPAPDVEYAIQAPAPLTRAALDRALSGAIPGLYTVGADGLAASAGSRPIAGPGWANAASIWFSGHEVTATTTPLVGWSNLEEPLAIAVVLPKGQRLFGPGTLEMIAPTREQDKAFGSHVNSIRGARYVAFEPRLPGAFADGTYQMTLTPDGAAEQSWTLEIAAGHDPETPPPLLVAARAYAAVSRPWTVVTRNVQDDSGFADPHLPLLATAVTQLPGRAPVDPARLGTTCAGGTLLNTAFAEVGIGVAPLAGGQPRPMRLARVFTGGRSIDVPIWVASDPASNLAIVRHAEDSWAPGYYVLHMAFGRQDYPVVLCFGSQGPTGISVPSAAGRSSARH